MSVSKINTSRLILLGSCLVLVIGGIAMRYLSLAESGSREFTSGAMIKVGIVAGLAWLAAPQLERLGWQRLRGGGLLILLAVGVLTAIRPRFGAIAAALTVAGFLILAVLGWVRGVIFNAPPTAVTGEKSRKIEKNPTRQ